MAENLDVFFGDTKFLTIDRPVDDFTVTPDNIIKVDKVDGSPNQLSLVGLAGGSATLMVKSAGRSLLYDVTVSPAPERLYINLNESKRLSFADPIDDTSLSQPASCGWSSPTAATRSSWSRADVAGKTTLTVYSKGQIYRYFISTFENRGADVLEIENAFSAKGYRNLTIAFDKDQAILSGTVPTQEELDDAVRIVKQFTDYVRGQGAARAGGRGERVHRGRDDHHQQYSADRECEGADGPREIPGPAGHHHQHLHQVDRRFRRALGHDHAAGRHHPWRRLPDAEGSQTRPARRRADRSSRSRSKTPPRLPPPPRTAPSRKRFFFMGTWKTTWKKPGSSASRAPSAPLLFPFSPSRTRSSFAPRSASFSWMKPRP